MAFRCRECKYGIIDGKCACNSDVGQGRYVSSHTAKLARWAARGVLPDTPARPPGTVGASRYRAHSPTTPSIEQVFRTHRGVTP